MLPPSPSGPSRPGPGSLTAPTSPPPPPADRSPGEDGATPWYSRRWVWVAGAIAFVIAAALGTSLVVRVPYYSFSPGTLYPAADQVQVEGAEVHPPEGRVLLTTVSISRRRLTVWNAVAGWLDPTVTVMDEEAVVGPGQSRDDIRQVNLQLMDTSKEVATYVALDRLGYEVEVVGTGAMVAQVSEGTPADGVLAPGDTVVAVDGEPVSLAGELVEVIGRYEPGDEVRLEVEPMGSDEVEERSVTLAAREDDESVAFLGVVPVTRDGSFVFPFDIDIDTGTVGGPSAGLSFTLTILDLLTPGELTGGQTVAVTGTIDVEGNVGPIGGVEQKAAAARRDGVDVFLVPGMIPDEELDAARDQAGDEVEIIEVGTLDEALAALESVGGDPLPEMAEAA